jgi:hypothetical protein
VKQSCIRIKFEVDTSESIKRLVPKVRKNLSDVVRDATQIGLPWLQQPPKNTIAHETLQGLAILHGGISSFTKDIQAVREIAEEQKKVAGIAAAAVAPMVARLSKLIHKAHAVQLEIEQRTSILTTLRPLSHPVLLKLKTLAEQENGRLLDGDPDRVALKGLIKALEEMGVG